MYALVKIDCTDWHHVRTGGMHIALYKFSSVTPYRVPAKNSQKTDLVECCVTSESNCSQKVFKNLLFFFQCKSEKSNVTKHQSQLSKQQSFSVQSASLSTLGWAHISSTSTLCYDCRLKTVNGLKFANCFAKLRKHSSSHFVCFDRVTEVLFLRLLVLSPVNEWHSYCVIHHTGRCIQSPWETLSPE